MYRCQQCGTVAQARTPSNLVVTKIRRRTYMERRAVRGRGRGRPTFENVEAGKGWERVEEKLVCTDCAKKMNADESIPVEVDLNPPTERVTSQIDVSETSQ